MATISVCIPNYNHGQYIGETLKAVLTQSLPPTEVIVVDDASTDNSVAVIGTFAREHPSLRMIINPSNKGALYSVNHALAQATGEFVYLVASDDKPLPRFFEKAVAILQRFPEAGMCATAIDFIDASSRRVDPRQRPFFHTHEKHVRIAEPVFLSPGDVLERLRRQPWFLGGVTSVLFRRGPIQEAGGMVPEFGPITDWFASHLVALKYGMCYVPEPLVAFRLVPGSFGTSAAARPSATMEYASRMVQRMREPMYRTVFPPSFVEHTRKTFTYYAFRTAFVEWYRGFLRELSEAVPPSTVTSRLLLNASRFLFKLQWVVLKAYCRNRVAGPLLENSAGSTETSQ